MQRYDGWEKLTWSETWHSFKRNVRFHYNRKDVVLVVAGFVYMAMLGALCGGMLGLDPFVGCSVRQGALVGASILDGVWLVMQLYILVSFGLGPRLPDNPDLY